MAGDILLKGASEARAHADAVVCVVGYARKTPAQVLYGAVTKVRVGPCNDPYRRKLKVFPSIQPEGEPVPAAVYYCVGEDTIQGLGGSKRQVEVFRLDLRAGTYDELAGILKDVLAELRKTGRFNGQPSCVDDYDLSLKIYRRIVTLGIRA